MPRFALDLDRPDHRAIAQREPLTDRAAFLVDCLDLEEATGVEGAVWERFQLAHLNDDGKFRIENKSRQVAFSWTSAAEAVAVALLEGQSTVFVSINEEEAQEKIRYAKAVYGALSVPWGRTPIKRDSLTTLEFVNGARLLSNPAKAVRGKSRFNVVLDEFAHVPGDREIYKGSLPVITRGGRVRVGSSPFGASGLFWEIDTEAIKPYPRYRRSTTPWWEVAALCNDVPGAMEYAPRMTTRERVGEFGSEVLVEIYESLPVEDFQQEYECAYLDEQHAWITWEEIRANQHPELACSIVSCEALNTAPARLAIAKLRGMIERGEVEGHLAAGFDVGRTRNASELWAVGVGPSPSTPVRLGISLKAMPFPQQYDVLAYALQQLPIFRLQIDRNGLGRQLAEDFESSHPVRAVGVDFTNAAKVEWATAMKVALQRHRLPLPVDRDLAYQLHSVKRKITGSTRAMVFDVAKNERHHADKFWALALALDSTQEAVGGGFGVQKWGG